MTTDTLERTFTCPESPQLTLSNVRGSVVIRSGEVGTITVHAVKHIDSGDGDRTHIQFSQSNSGSVTVSTQFDNHWFRFLSRSRPCEVDYVVTVPENCDLKVRGVSNSAKIQGVAGRLNISTVTGPLECLSLSGNIQVKTVSGDIKGESLSGSATLKGVSGDFFLGNCQFQALKVKTVSGDFSIESSLGDGPFDFESVSGDIQLVMPVNQGVTVISSSLSGDVRAPSRISQMNRSKDHRRIEILDGGVKIHHHSVSGDLFITSEESNGEMDETLDLIAGENYGNDRVEILNRISTGDLSVEEALQQFEEVTRT